MILAIIFSINNNYTASNAQRYIYKGLKLDILNKIPPLWNFAYFSGINTVNMA